MPAFYIVIADDDEDDFFMIREAFNKLFDHNIVPVIDGRQLIDYLAAEEKLKKTLPDLILLDINMPKMNGIAALEIIKSSDHLKRIPVIMHSTSSNDDQMETCRKLGAIGFVTKASNQKDITNFVVKINKLLEDLRRAPEALLFIR